MYHYIISIALLIVLAGCSAHEPQQKEVSPAAQVTILLDLSDRLIAHPDQVDRDITLIRGIYEGFRLMVKKERYINTRHRFQILIAHQKEGGIPKLDFEDRLQLDLNKVKTQRVALKKFGEQMEGTLAELYEQASQGVQPSDYQGADLWRFFQDDWKLSVNRKRFQQHYLFILTDGYLDFEEQGNRMQKGKRYTHARFLKQLRRPGWKEKMERQDYGFLLPEGCDLSGLHVALLEVDPRPGFQQESLLLHAVWRKWLGEMHADDSHIVSRQSLKVMQQEIEGMLME